MTVTRDSDRDIHGKPHFSGTKCYQVASGCMHVHSPVHSHIQTNKHNHLQIQEFN